MKMEEIKLVHPDEPEETKQPQRVKRLSILRLIGILILFLALVGGGCFYFFKGGAKSLNIAGVSEEEMQKIDALIAKLGEKNTQIKVLEEENSQLRAEVQSVTNRLRYVIKPQKQVVAECYVAKVGKYNLPTLCKQTLAKSVKELLDANKKIVALEVSGVVDTQAYRGLSPELKQEGLASFRAKEVITYLRKAFPSVTTFEGLSVQEEKKRGFFIRAYYVQ